MNQELMTLDFWQDTVIYEGKTFPVGTLACDALNVSADTLAQMNEQCQKINLLLGMLNAGQDASALFPMARDAALAMLDILSKTPPFSYIDIPKHREQIEKAKKLEDKLLPEDIDYSAIDGLRLEAREKLAAIRPRSLGQAARISGVSPADISVLMIFLALKNRGKN